MNSTTKIKGCFSLLCIFNSHAVLADGWPLWVPDSAIVPFAFTSESLGNAVGIAGVAKGVLQPQMSLLGMGLYTDKGSYVTYLSMANYQTDNNWLLGLDFYQGNYIDSNYYLAEQGNNSNQGDDITVTTATESKYRASFRYILPWGDGRKLGTQAGYIPNRELSGSDPNSSGVSSIEIRPFYSTRDLDVAYQEPEETWGVELNLDWDNRNDTRNSTEGSRTRLNFTYSPEYKDDASWAKVSFENNQYWDLGSLGDIFDKQVLAFSVYTADTPTWNQCTDNVCNRPPEYERVKLGGLYRLRSYTAGRFHGRSAINYTAEYRVMPEWQPLGSWPIFSLYNIPWWQWVVFSDVGRVADEYNLKTLHEDMKWSTGGAIRFQVEGVVVRTEMAWGNDESLFRVMVNQPF